MAPPLPPLERGGVYATLAYLLQQAYFGGTGFSDVNIRMAVMFQYPFQVTGR